MPQLGHLLVRPVYYIYHCVVLEANTIDFINNFKTTHHIPLDPVYTGKMLFGLWDLIEKDYFSRGSTIIAIHTGGLQGIEGMNQRIKNKGLQIL